LAFVGLWEGWKDKTTGKAVENCTVITTDPNELMKPDNRIEQKISLGGSSRAFSSKDAGPHSGSWPVTRELPRSCVSSGAGELPIQQRIRCEVSMCAYSSASAQKDQGCTGTHMKFLRARRLTGAQANASCWESRRCGSDNRFLSCPTPVSSPTRQLPFSKQHRVGRNLTASSDRLPLVTAMLGLALLCRFFVLR
jgi:hypothetical protein